MTAAARGTSETKIPQWNFADRMRKIRTGVLDLQQAEFAERLGVKKDAYTAWETGRTKPRDILGIARRVELLTGIPAAWVLGVDAPPPIEDPVVRINRG